MADPVLTRKDFLLDIYCIMSALALDYTGEAKENFAAAFEAVDTCNELSDEARDLAKYALEYAYLSFRSTRDTGDPSGTVDAVIFLGTAYRSIALDDLKFLKWLFSMRPPLIRSDAPKPFATAWLERLREEWNELKLRIRG